MPIGELAPLKVSVQDGKACEKILKIQLSESDIRKEYDHFYKSIAPKAKLPGFRPGKAPRNVLELHFKDEARSSVLKELITDSFRKAVQEKSLEPLGYPEVENVKFDEKSLSYHAKIETRPKIKLNRVAGLKVKREAAEVSEKDIEEQLKRVQESMAQFKAVEDRGSAMGDFLIADFTCTVEGKEIDKRQDDWFELREDEYVKGLSAKLVGLKPGEAREVQVTLPENFGRKEFANKDASFHVTVKELKSKSLPPIDDELAKDAGEFKTLEELKAKIRKDALAAKEREKEKEFEKRLMDELIKQNKIDLPEKLVQRREEHLLKDTMEQYRRHGLPEDTLKELETNMKKDLKEEARRQVHVAFLLDELAIRENLTVSEQDVKDKLQGFAAQIRQPLEAVERYYGQNEEALASLRDQIRNEKAIDFIKKNVKDK